MWKFLTDGKRHEWWMVLFLKCLNDPLGSVYCLDSHLVTESFLETRQEDLGLWENNYCLFFSCWFPVELCLEPCNVLCAAGVTMSVNFVFFFSLGINAAHVLESAKFCLNEEVFLLYVMMSNVRTSKVLDIHLIVRMSTKIFAWMGDMKDSIKCKYVMSYKINILPLLIWVC